eukprot:27083-Pelagococcus_subviridis.AAC.2
MLTIALEIERRRERGSRDRRERRDREQERREERARRHRASHRATERGRARERVRARGRTGRANARNHTYSYSLGFLSESNSRYATLFYAHPIPRRPRRARRASPRVAAPARLPRAVVLLQVRRERVHVLRRPRHDVAVVSSPRVAQLAHIHPLHAADFCLPGRHVHGLVAL